MMRHSRAGVVEPRRSKMPSYPQQLALSSRESPISSRKSVDPSGNFETTDHPGEALYMPLFPGEEYFDHGGGRIRS